MAKEHCKVDSNGIDLYIEEVRACYTHICATHGAIGFIVLYCGVICMSILLV